MEQFIYWFERLRVFSLAMFYTIVERFGSLTGIAPLDRLLGVAAAVLVFGAVLALPLYILFFRPKR